jgi:hypothetical protein
VTKPDPGAPSASADSPKVHSPAAGSRPPSPPADFQLIMLAVANAAALIFVAVVRAAGGSGLSIPAAFLGLQIFTVFASALLRGAVPVVQAFDKMADEDQDHGQDHNERQPSRFEKWWVENREPILKWSVIGLSAVMVISFYTLVSATGGGVRSPFMPILEAPAVLGPFIAEGAVGVALSSVVVSTAITIQILLGPVVTKPPHADQRTYAALVRATHYDRGTHIAVVLFVIGVATVISVEQKRRRRRRARNSRDTTSVQIDHHVDAESAGSQ